MSIKGQDKDKDKDKDIYIYIYNIRMASVTFHENVFEPDPHNFFGISLYKTSVRSGYHTVDINRPALLCGWLVFWSPQSV